MIPLYTYFEPVHGINIEDSTRLLLLWRDNWRSFGYDPIVLGEYHARQHRRFVEFEDKISRLPTINPKDYERSCYLRYLAVAHAGGGIMTDYDVQMFKDEINEELPDRLISLQRHTPSVVIGSEKAFNKIVQAIYTYEVTINDISEAGVPHVSDMYIFLRNRAMPYEGRNIVRNYGEPGWLEAPIVHFSNGSMKGLKPRWKAIKEIIQKK